MASNAQLGWIVGVFVGTLASGTLAQFVFRHTYNRYTALISAAGVAAATVARQLLDGLDLLHVVIVPTLHRFDDRYDLRAHTLYLSSPQTASVAALAVTAHEVGHAWQHEQRYWALRWRRWVHALGHGGALAALGAILMGWTYSNDALLTYGVWTYGGVVVLLLLGLPVELDANRRALRLLVEGNLIRGRDERRATRRLLSCALLTYISAALNPAVHALFALWQTRR